MDGLFFDKEETAKQYKPKRVKAKAKALDCEGCGLYKESVYHPKMDYHGKGGKGVLIIGEAPGPEEDEQDMQWVGKVGQSLRKSLRRVGLNLDEDCWFINAVNCFPGRDYKDEIKNPTTKQVACCKVVKVQPAIEELKPRVIILMGNSAVQSFYAGRVPGLKITKFRGRAFPDAQTGAWVLPLFHPSFIDRNKGDTLEALWHRDLLRVVNRIERDRPPVIADPTKQVVTLDDFDELVDIIGNVRKHAAWVVFDYETTGLKPYAPGHKIISVSFAVRWEGEDEISGYTFALHHPLAPWKGLELGHIEEAWKNLMRDSSVPKIAHNIKHEDMWSREILGVPVEGWSWDTMVNAHIIDNTRGITGLKFQAFQNWGIEGYDALSKKFVEGVLTPEQREAGQKVSSHSHNKMLQMPLDELLTYGGCDAITCAMLYEKQVKQIRVGTPMWEAMDLFHKALLMFCDLQDLGVPIDEEYFDVKKAELEATQDELTKALLRTREAKLFYEKEGRAVNLGSNTDLPKLLYEHLGETPRKRTKLNNPSVDAEALARLDLPFTNKLIEIRKLQKISGTFMDQLRRESVDGRAYPSTNFNTTVTYRPSMDEPNLANTPKREPVAKELVRHGVRAEHGHKFMEADYGGIEVCGLGWYSHDRALLDYLHDPTTDMHRDQAQAIFKISPKDWSELDPKAVFMLRFFAKNQFVFPEFYGSWYLACAENIWKHCADLLIGDGDTTVKQWLGMSYTRFEEHIRLHENDFWDTFKGVRKWQDGVQEEYIAKGYIETFLGFRYGGWMTRNNLYNYKVQGTAFHLLLWAMIQMHKQNGDRGRQSRLMWQIYDSMIWSLSPPEQAEVVAACEHMMCVEAPKHFDWINTPLKAEFEITKTGGRFADLKGLDETDNYEEVE